MKRLIILLAIFLLSSCFGKMEDIELSCYDVALMPERSSYVVTSDVELNIDIVDEGDSSGVVPQSDSYGMKYKGAWMTVTNYGKAILIEATENTSGNKRTGHIELRAKDNPNKIGSIKVTQENN